MAIDPNIALGIRPIEVANPLAQYGQIAQLQNYQNQNALAQYQLESAKRQDLSQNALAESWKAAFNPDTGKVDENALFKGLSERGAGHLIPETQTKLLASQKELSQISKNKAETEASQFKLQKDKLNHGLESLTSAPTPQDAIAKLNEGVTKGYFDMKTASAEAQRLQNMTPEKYREYRIEKILGLVDNKDRLAAMLPKVTRQDIGGSIVNIQDNPMMPGYGQPMANMPGITKTATVADKIAQQRANTAAEQLALDRQSVVYQTDANGNVVALPSKLKSGEVPTGRTAVAPGGGFQPMMAKPSEAEGKEQMSINQQKAIVKGALDAVAQTPDAFGYMAGSVPESARARMASSEENTNRSYLFNVVSGVIKERAGTAQSASEAQTLARFLPVETDNADIITDKLKGFEKYLNDKEAGTTKKRPAAKPAAAGIDTSNPLLK